MLESVVSAVTGVVKKVRTSSCHGIGEANVECCISQRGERHSLLACYIFRASVFVAYCVFDL